MKFAALMALLVAAAPARAIELSLEENRSERGSVGYVDMQRLFAASPDAQRAREGFEDLVRQAEERVNLRRAELLKLRRQLEDAISERRALGRAVPVDHARPPATPPVAALSEKTPAPSPLLPPAIAVASSSATIATSTAVPLGATPLPGSSSVAASTAAPREPTLPGMTTTPASPSASTTTVKALDLDEKIVALQAEVSSRENDLVREHDDSDRGLLDVEGRKTDQVLARLYRAITAVARREGVGVVVDKTTVIYGHPAVDLTDKILKYLHEAPAP